MVLATGTTGSDYTMEWPSGQTTVGPPTLQSRSTHFKNTKIKNELHGSWSTQDVKPAKFLIFACVKTYFFFSKWLVSSFTHYTVYIMMTSSAISHIIRFFKKSLRSQTTSLIKDSSCIMIASSTSRVLESSDRQRITWSYIMKTV